MSERLIIERIARTTVDGQVEALEFKEGVNAIVGPQNTGKSTWLKMLDFLMADGDSAYAKFDEVIVKKYSAVSSLMRFGDEVVELERQWSEDGVRSQMKLNGDRVTGEEVQQLFLERLSIPTLRYPQGNIYASDRTWPTLGWRSLLRHIYRRQDYWSDLVPNQPDSEQHACVLQFLGLAEHVFSSDLSTLTDKRKKLSQLQTKRDYFLELMQQLLPNLMEDPDLGQGITGAAIEKALLRIEAEIEDLLKQRLIVLAQVRDQSHVSRGQVDALLEERNQLLHERDRASREATGIQDRVAELQDYQIGLHRELLRLDRAGSAAEILEDLKVTHCPACDQSVEDRTQHADSCFLCGQLTLSRELNPQAAARRLKFERDQLTAEAAEADELLDATRQELRRKQVEMADAARRVRETELLLRPFQAAASAIIPEELTLIDQRMGALQGRRVTVEALRDPLEESVALSKEIAGLEDEIKELESLVGKREAVADFEQAGERLGDGFNTYLNTIRERDESSWTKTGQVAAWINERKTQLQIGGRPAKSQLGGTLTIYFVFAYHYALLNLSRYPDCHYPGLAVLDFYPDIARESALGDRLNLVLSPFVELSQDASIQPVQVIATSRALTDRPNINFIRLTEAWR